MPEVRPITDLGRIRVIYRARMRRDFARGELRPFSSIRKSFRKGNYACFGLYEGETLLGYAFFVQMQAGERRYDLFDYFAIDESRRDQGLGTVFLQGLSDMMREADCVIGEVEDPDFAADEDDRTTRERRIAFYLRSGFRMTTVKTRLFGVDYCIMEATPGAPTPPETIRAIYPMLYRLVLPDWLLKRQLKMK